MFGLDRIPGGDHPPEPKIAQISEVQPTLEEGRFLTGGGGVHIDINLEYIKHTCDGPMVTSTHDNLWTLVSDST